MICMSSNVDQASRMQDSPLKGRQSSAKKVNLEGSYSAIQYEYMNL